MEIRSKGVSGRVGLEVIYDGLGRVIEGLKMGNNVTRVFYFRWIF